MNNTNLAQNDADALISMRKVRADENVRNVSLPQSLVVPLVSEDKREHFQLDIRSGRIDLSKVTYQTRGRQVVVLIRLDVGGPPHRNPDGNEMPCPHLHLYREGYGDKWAVPVPIDKFTDLNDHWKTLHEFMDFCAVEVRPCFQKGVFS